MPKTQDYFNMSDLEALMEGLTEFLDEQHGVYGQCLNCGEMIDISVCDRCGCIFEGESNEEGPDICDNCWVKFEEE